MIFGINNKLPRAKLFISLSTLVKAFFKVSFGSLKRGERAKVFEKSVSSFWNVKHCVSLSSARVCLYFILKSLNLKKGDEVLLTPLTIPDIVNAIHILGLKPIFVEMSLDDQNIKLNDLDLKVTASSRVLLITHLCGIVPDMDLILERVKSNNLILIEDISQNYGAEYEGKLLGTFGVASIGSLSVTKTISSLAGGIILTDDDNLVDKVREYSNKKLRRPRRISLLNQVISQIKIALATSRFVFPLLTYYFLRFVYVIAPDKFETIQKGVSLSKDPSKLNCFQNFPILRSQMPNETLVWFSDLQSDIALTTIRKLKTGIDKRRKLARILYDNLKPEVQNFFPEKIRNFTQNIYWHFPIVIDGDRQSFQAQLLKKGFDVVGYNLVLCSEEPAFSCYRVETPMARIIKKNTIFLPMHEHFDEEEIVKLAESVNHIL